MFNAVKLGSAVSQELMDYKLILLHEIFLQFDWLRAVEFQINFKPTCENYKPCVGSSINK